MSIWDKIKDFLKPKQPKQLEPGSGKEENVKHEKYTDIRRDEPYEVNLNQFNKLEEGKADIMVSCLENSISYFLMYMSKDQENPEGTIFPIAKVMGGSDKTLIERREDLKTYLKGYLATLRKTPNNRIERMELFDRYFSKRLLKDRYFDVTPEFEELFSQPQNSETVVIEPKTSFKVAKESIEKLEEEFEKSNAKQWREAMAITSQEKQGEQNEEILQLTQEEVKVILDQSVQITEEQKIELLKKVMKVNLRQTAVRQETELAKKMIKETASLSQKLIEEHKGDGPIKSSVDSEKIRETKDYQSNPMSIYRQLNIEIKTLEKEGRTRDLREEQREKADFLETYFKGYVISYLKENQDMAIEYDQKASIEDKIGDTKSYAKQIKEQMEKRKEDEEKEM